MPSQRLIPILVLILSAVLSGCYNQPRRHLASDAILIEVGSSTRNDVLTYLGEPDKQRILDKGREEWVFIEETPSNYQRAPLLGGFFKGKGYENVFIVFQDDIVQLCQFRENAKDELDWADVYSWQETEE
jgi:hypothetical protein